jgi:hypothetical protein
MSNQKLLQWLEPESVELEPESVEVVIISWDFLPTEPPWTETTVTKSLKPNLHSVTIRDIKRLNQTSQS